SVDAIISNVDRKNRVINLSIKSKDAVADKQAIADQRAKSESEAKGPTTIGDLIKEQLSQKGE
ncbi:MAG: 30S ribosomal protein S1, partial [Oleispira antarctica]|nr:30S ribosomal protein S1 [Oleispira antarctica]